jgi:hypothetical protein
LAVAEGQADPCRTAPSSSVAARSIGADIEITDWW